MSDELTVHRLKLIEKLQATTCEVCSKAKDTRKSFCRSCYRKLQPETKEALYRRIGAGYEDTHAQALKELREKIEHRAIVKQCDQIIHRRFEGAGQSYKEKDQCHADAVVQAADGRWLCQKHHERWAVKVGKPPLVKMIP